MDIPTWRRNKKKRPLGIQMPFFCRELWPLAKVYFTHNSEKLPTSLGQFSQQLLLSLMLASLIYGGHHYISSMLIPGSQWGPCRYAWLTAPLGQLTYPGNDRTLNQNWQTKLSQIYSWFYIWFYIFSPNRPTGPIQSSSRDVYVFIYLYLDMSPSHVIFFKVSHWPSDHMIRSRPLIGHPPPPLTPTPPPLQSWIVHAWQVFHWWTGAIVDQLIEP